MTKKKRKSNWLRGPAPSDSPIYQSGRMLLRPIHRRKAEPSDETTVSAESSESTDTDQESSESGN